MQSIFEAIKETAIEIQKLIEQGDTSKSELENATGDTQLKLDIKSDLVIEKIFAKVACIKQIVSEEQEEIKYLHENGKYLIAYDPLDGSSLVDVNLSLGSIFGIYENSFEGKNIVASVYVVFGPRVELIIAHDDVKMYRLLNGKFEFIQLIKLEEKGNLSAPGSTQMCWEPHHRKLIDDMFEESYTLRYSGGMVPDLHQILIKGGGLFSYPGTSDRPEGKLRKLFEVFPFAYTFEKANGASINGKQRVLDVETGHIHETSPAFFGSKEEINRVLAVYKDNE
ncbi:MAG: class 1 fructose-bisphosphatase [Arcobacteraceae bacterium]